MDDQLIQQIVTWAQSAVADTLLLIIGIYLITMMVSEWNSISSRHVSVFVALALGVCGWFAGYFKAHTWFEAVIYTAFAWYAASKFYGGKDPLAKGPGRIIAEATVLPLADGIRNLTGSAPQEPRDETQTPTDVRIVK